MKKIILLLLCLCISIGTMTAQTYSGGDGSKTSPYLISTRADMKALAGAVNGGNSYAGKFFLLTKDLRAINTSVGNLLNYSKNDTDFGEGAFSGIFDGGGHTIELKNTQNGVFTYVYGATIQNLNVKGTVLPLLEEELPAFGGICGMAETSTIIYCSNTATISVTNAPIYGFLGGICGATMGTVISNCYNLGDITVTQAVEDTSIGGIVGMAVFNTSIFNCYNLANITADKDQNTIAGGILGAGEGKSDPVVVSNCFAANSSLTAGVVDRITIFADVMSNNYALSGMTLNGEPVSGEDVDANGLNGADATADDFKSADWIETNLTWNLDAIWEMSAATSANKGLPALANVPKTTTYIISASAGANGTISPTGSVAVPQGENLTLTMTPANGFVISQVLVNGKDQTLAVTPEGEYTFTNVMTNQIIFATFLPTYSGGTGSKTDPYLISSKADMEILADVVNNGQSTYAGKFFLLTTDLTDITTSIGFYDQGNGGSGGWDDIVTSFNGVFDGGGHTIAVNNALGVFGYIHGGTVQNLGVTGSVSLTSISNPNSIHTGGICAYAKQATVNYCFNTASVVATVLTEYSYAYAGGIIGGNDNSSIANCYNIGAIQSYYAGGICGLTSASASTSASISNCYNLGNVTASAANPSSYTTCGGIVGDGNITVSNCFAANAALTANGGMGRITGSNTGDYTDNCYALFSMTLNGEPVSSTDANGEDGADATLDDFKSPFWFANKLPAWDFSTVWEMSDANSDTKGLPVFNNSSKTVSYTITATAGEHGSISPAGSVAVNQGEDLSYTITPADGFKINHLYVENDYDDKAAEIVDNHYTFTAIATNHTIFVDFKLTTSPTYSGGNGSASNPYLISTKADMEALANAVSGGTDYYKQYFLLTNDLTGSNALTTSVGFYIESYHYNLDYPFSGIFDGNGKTIELKDAPNGVFAQIYEATIQDLKVTGTISVSSPAQTNDFYAGGVAGLAQHAKITNCSNAATITSDLVTGNSYRVGGICGQANNTHLSYCSNLVPIAVSLTNSIGGGICGMTYNSTISNCYNLGNITTTTWAGGICGHASSSNNGNDDRYVEAFISTCYNLGNITATAEAGGICGDINNLTITNCFAANSTIDFDIDHGSANRICAFNQWNNATIIDCYALATMTINGSTDNITDNLNGLDGMGATFASFQLQQWITENLGWDFTTWKMSENSSPNKGLPTFQTTCNVLASIGKGGVISPEFDNIVAVGKNITFTFAANADYEIDKVLVDGTNNPDAITAGSYTFSNVSANHTIQVLLNYLPTIYVTVGTGGDVSPINDVVNMKQGSNQTFTLTAATGYEIDQVLVDAINDPTAVATGSYTFTNVTDDHEFDVTFKEASDPGPGPEPGPDPDPEPGPNPDPIDPIDPCVPNLIVQVWDDVLSVINNPAKNGGYTFTSYQWQKNGEDMQGETAGNLYITDAIKDYTTEYSVVVTTSTGELLQSCPVKLKEVTATLKSYPNPTSGLITIEGTAIQAGDKIEVYDAIGRLVHRSVAENMQTTIDLSSLIKGTYILKVNEEQVKVIKN
ncbi:MAG: T9SS type A sorting domain-containing protein [Candidatus Symbiothrix sp.]|jgi:hypothetical protein|nr:T9SS type A sorting domain-containing protein [Candidatus Symbiothrix sp.]